MNIPNLLAAIPYIVPPEKTLIEHVPILEMPLKLQVFGPLVATGVFVGIGRVHKAAKDRNMDPEFIDGLITWVLVLGFAMAHWVTALFYYPERVADDPMYLLRIWDGISSMGGFTGAAIGMTIFLWKNKQPFLPYADILVYGILIGWCFGRLGCTLVHDHPGKIVDASFLLAVGPWPDGTYRYDMGLYEWIFTLVLTAAVYLGLDWQKRRHGFLTGLVAMAYTPVRFSFDFLRADAAALGVTGKPDVRYLHLTFAQWACVAVFLIGAYLVFLRKPREADDAYKRAGSARAEKKNKKKK